MRTNDEILSDARMLYDLLSQAEELPGPAEMVLAMGGSDLGVADTAAEAFFQAVGFSRKALEPGALKKPGGPYDVQVWEKELSPKDPAAQRPTKPYLIENYDYEMAREQAAKLVREERRSKE